MVYSDFFKAFTCIIKIKKGTQFKFVVNGNKYCTSSLYIEVNDGNGNINNVYAPGILEMKVKKKKLSAKKLDQLRHEYPHMSDFEDVESI